MSKTSARDTRSVVYFELGSGSVAAACGVVQEGALKLTWSKRIYYPLHSTYNADQFTKITFSSLMELAMAISSEAIPNATQRAGFDPKHASCHVFLSAPWYVATTRTVLKEQELPFRISEDFVREHVEKDAQSVALAVTSTNQNPLMQKPESLETLILTAHLNGYPVRHYLNKESTSVLLTTYYSMIAKHTRETILEVLSRVLPHHTSQLHSTTLLHYHTLRTIEPYTRNSALIEVGAEITSVASVRDGILTQCMTFATGTNHFLRSVAHKSAKREEALSKVEQMLREGTDASLQAKDNALMRSIDAWRQELVEAIDTLVQGEPWPHTAALIVNGPWVPALQSSLGSYWQHDTFGAIEPMHLIPLTETLHGIRVETDNTRSDTRQILLGHALAQLPHIYHTSAL